MGSVLHQQLQQQQQGRPLRMRRALRIGGNEIGERQLGVADLRRYTLPSVRPNVFLVAPPG